MSRRKYGQSNTPSTIVNSLGVTFRVIIEAYGMTILLCIIIRNGEPILHELNFSRIGEAFNRLSTYPMGSKIQHKMVRNQDKMRKFRKEKGIRVKFALAAFKLYFPQVLISHHQLLYVHIKDLQLSQLNRD